MFWGFLLLGGLAFVFMQLGAMSVWVSVLKLALMLALLAVTVMGIVLLWRKVFPAKPVRQINQGGKYD